MKHLLLILSLTSTLGFSEGLTTQDVRALQRFKEQVLTGPRKVIATGKLEDVAQHHLDKRHSRQAGNVCSAKTEKDVTQPCCVDQVEMDFQKLGWDFILSPRTLQFSFCRGTCKAEPIRPALLPQSASQILKVRTKTIENESQSFDNKWI